MTYEDGRASPEAEQKLKERLDDNLFSRAAQIGPDVTIAELHTFGRHIAMHQYLTEEYSFERDEAERLLKSMSLT